MGMGSCVFVTAACRQEMPMDNATADAFLAAVKRARDLPHGKRPTDLHVRIAFILARWRTATPTHRQLARAAKCDPSTVARALARLHQLGLLSWTHRVLAGPGWRAQIANSYALLSSKPLSYLRLSTPGKLPISGGPSATDALAAIAQGRLTAVQAHLAAQKQARLNLRRAPMRR
jgi:DNA-binding transcriptional MocR family regulator